ncbi:DUF4430 domain-containing protein [Terrisporobacter petrolearius]|uniref:DUF4430 domain-containing protein n=1 Tax=Terrisporobacter petrolearius TaxID=1460447 RepID=UPI0031CC3817
MKQIKKIVISLLLIMVFAVTGCNVVSSGEGSGACGDNSKIPENGVVTAQTFEKIKNSGEMALFESNNKDFSYEWMFLASDIKEPKDINLKVNSVSENIDLVKEKSKSDLVYGFSFEETSSLESSTALSIIFNSKLKCSAADIYKLNSDKLEKVTTATVDFSSDKTTINFSIQDREGTFYIVGSDPKQAAIDADTDGSSSESSESSNSSNGGSSNDSKSDKAKQSLEYKKQMGINVEEGTPGKDGKDKYLTDPTPAGKPKPFEWNEGGNKIDKSKVAGYVTLSIDCKTLLKPANRKVAIENGKGDMIPSDGIIYKTKKVKFYKNEAVFDVLLREVKANKIHMEFSMTPIYNSNYIEGIHNLYEFDGGELSGWMYQVNGWYPNYGCSRYKLKNNDKIKWRYTCDLGQDVGCDWMANKK